MADPLKQISDQAEHLRGLCETMEALAQVLSDIDIDAVVAGLSHVLPAHFADESEALMPLLSVRVHQDDDLRHVMSAMADNHREATFEVRQLTPRVEALRHIDSDHQDHPSIATLLTSLAARVRHHLSLEAAVLLPIARLRLTQEDLHNMAASMAERRKAH